MKATQSFQVRSSLIAAVALTIPVLSLLLPVSLDAASVKFTNSGTFTPPPGITSVTVECWGGGGAGGSAQRTTIATSGGGGGGGGAYAKRLNVPVTPGISYTITIPAAVAARGASSGFVTGDRVDGASVTFTGDSDVSVTANGGQGGECAVNATGNLGAGGVAGEGLDGAFAGGNGAKHTTGNAGAGGSGASDLGPGNNAAGSTAGATKPGSDVDHNGGIGGSGKTGAGAGNGGATQPGGGGGGAKASVNNTAYAGSPGAKGQIIISYAGATVTKANNADRLNLGSSWTGGNPPDSAGIAKWDSTVTSANTTLLDADVTWGGLTIANPAGLVTLSAGNILTLNGGIDMSLATADLTLNCDLALGGSAAWNVAESRTLTLGGVISGDFNITEQGTGKVILAAANTYTGATAITGGTLQLGASGVIPDGGGKGNVSVAASCNLDLNGFSEIINGLSGAGMVDNTGASTTATLTVGGNNVDSSFSGVIQNSGTASVLNLTKIGSGILTLSGTNTFTGTATVNGGNLTLATANPLGSISGLTIGEAQLGCSVSNAVIPAPITLTGNLTVIVQSSGILTSLNGAIGGTGNLTFATGNNTLNGDNRVSLGAASDFTGNVMITTTGVTTVNNMTVRLGAVNALPTTAVVTLDGQNGNGISWCDLNLQGFDQTLAGLKNVTRTSRLQRIYNGGTTAATLTINNTDDCTFGGKLGKANGDDFSLTKSGSGMFTLTNSNSYTGATTVQAGTLALGVSDALADTTAVTIGNATLDAGIYDDSVGTLEVTGTATINLGSGANLVFADSSSITWTGTLNVTGSFVSGGPDGSLRFGTNSSGLTSAQLALISATGVVSFALDANGFLTAGAPGGYSNWATTHAPTGSATEDYDGDGVSNGEEYFLGGTKDTNDLSKLPKISTSGGNLVFTFTRDQASINATTTAAIEMGTDLATWPTSYAVPTTAVAGESGLTVVKDSPAGFDTVTLSLPQTPDPIKFARLKVTVTP